MKPLHIKVGRDSDGNVPLCPWCEAPLTTIKDYRSHLKFMSNLHVFTCPHCNKAINAVAASK